MSLIVTLSLVATIVPLVLPVLICTEKVSDPSVVASATVVTLKEPALVLIVNDPEVAEKSPAADVP